MSKLAQTRSSEAHKKQQMAGRPSTTRMLTPPYASILALHDVAGNRAVSDQIGREFQETAQRVVRSPGQSLEPAIRSMMESRLGHDFGAVRVHTNAPAAQSALALNSTAYTVGKDIVFGSGQYNPNSSNGVRLLAHELAHVIQQSRTGSQKTGLVNHPADVFEADADRAAEMVSAGRLAQVAAQGPPPAIQRQTGRERTPVELAETELGRGPTRTRRDRRAWRQATRRATGRGGAAGRIQIPTSNRHSGVRPVSNAEFLRQWSQCPDPRRERGLRPAFMCSDASIGPVNVQTDRTTETTVLIDHRARRRGGSDVWVVSARLPWVLITAGYLDVSRVSPTMLRPTSRHERGHRAISERIRDRLAPLLQAELVRSLPSPRRPWRAASVQAGGDRIFNRTRQIVGRYKRWWDQLAGRADDAWDAQEARTLSRIAAARTPSRRTTVPPRVPPAPRRRRD